jgi:peptidoglycan-associated lipoprotein
MPVTKTWRSLAIASICIGSLLGGTACRSKPVSVHVAEGGSDVLKTDILRGDHPLGPVDELGTRVEGVKFDTVLFAFDSAQIASAETPKIEAVAQWLKTNAGTRALVEGHCDERGTAEYNMALGERRALAVRTHLIGLGIDTARIITRSYGKEKPLDAGHGESAWRLNRRVEFAMYR